MLKTASGAGPPADGYGVFDDYDLGSKDQKFSVPTRFGSKERLQRCVAVMRGNGLDVYVDTVPHQRSGGDDFVYTYPGADAAPGVGRFPKHADCFVPNVPRDPIAGPVIDDRPFGDELAPLNGLPPGYVLNGLTEAGDWMTRTLDVQGYRVDDVKGLAVDFVRHWLSAKAMATRFAVGEYFDGNPQALNWWIWDSGMAGRCQLFDFSLRFTLAGMCSNPSGWDMRQLDHAGLAGISPGQAVTFVENLDTDRNEPIVTNKLLAYAYILTAEGYPCVFYRDYSTDEGCYGLKHELDNLIWIHENLAAGSTTTRWADYQSFVYERTGYPNLLVGMNNDASDWRTVTVGTDFGPNVQLHDYTGRAGDVWTDGNGVVTIGLPPNDNGRGYIAYSRVGHDQPFTAPSWPATQSFDGAVDLDVPPMTNGRPITVGRVWCRPHAPVTVRFIPVGAPAGQVHITMTGPQHHTVIEAAFAAASDATIQGTTGAAGWYSVVITGRDLPPGAHAFRTDVTYTAPSGLET